LKKTIKGFFSLYNPKNIPSRGKKWAEYFQVEVKLAEPVAFPIAFFASALSFVGIIFISISILITVFGLT
jgi:hypothetical protein